MPPKASFACGYYNENCYIEVDGDRYYPGSYFAVPSGKTIKAVASISNSGERGVISFWVKDETNNKWLGSDDSTLNTGDVYDFEVSFTLSPGSYTIKFYGCHKENTSIFIDEHGGEFNITVEEAGYISIIDIQFDPATPFDDEVTDIKALIKNTGGQTVTENIHCYVDGYELPDSPKQVTLKPDEQTTVTFSRQFYAGDHTVQVTSDEDSRTETITVKKRIEVSVSLNPDNPKIGQPFTLIATVKNNSGERLTKMACPSGDLYGLPCQYVTLQPYSSKTLYWDKRQFTEPGEYVFGVCVNGICSSDITRTPEEASDSEWSNWLLDWFYEGVDFFISMLNLTYDFITAPAWNLFGNSLWEDSIDSFFSALDALYNLTAEQFVQAGKAMYEGIAVGLEEAAKSTVLSLAEWMTTVFTPEEITNDTEELISIIERAHTTGTTEYVEMSGSWAVVAQRIAPLVAAWGTQTFLSFIIEETLQLQNFNVKNAIETRQWELAEQQNNILNALTWMGCAGLLFSYVVAGYLIIRDNKLNQVIKIAGVAVSTGILWVYMGYIYASINAYKTNKSVIEIQGILEYSPPPPDTPTGVLDISSDPSDAEVFIWQDNEWKSLGPFRKTPTKVVVSAGEHKIKVVGTLWIDGHKKAVAETTVNVNASDVTEVSLTLQPVGIPEEITGEVQEVHSGHTFEILDEDRYLWTCRVAGIDSHRLFDDTIYCSNCGGARTLSWEKWFSAAKNAVAQVIEGKRVHLMIDPDRPTINEFDSKEEKTVLKLLVSGTIETTGEDIAESILETGYACCNFKEGYINKYVDTEKLTAAEKEAINNRYGYWAELICPTLVTITLESTPSANIYIDRTKIIG